MIKIYLGIEYKQMHYKTALCLFPRMKYLPKLGYIKKIVQEELEEDKRVKIIAQNFEISEREALLLLRS